MKKAVQQVLQACDFDAQLAQFGFQDALIGLALSGECLTERLADEPSFDERVAELKTLADRHNKPLRRARAEAKKKAKKL